MSDFPTRHGTTASTMISDPDRSIVCISPLLLADRVSSRMQPRPHSAWSRVR